MKPEDFAKNLERIMGQLIKEATSKESLQALGDEAAELIKKRTRLGYGVDKHDGAKFKLAPLDDKYKKVRAKKATGPTTPAKSNLTLTGDMLDKIGATVENDNSVSIGFKDGFAGDKATWNTDKGRPFNFLSKPEIAQLRKRLQDKLYTRIKSLTSN